MVFFRPLAVHVLRVGRASGIPASASIASSGRKAAAGRLPGQRDISRRRIIYDRTGLPGGEKRSNIPYVPQRSAFQRLRTQVPSSTLCKTGFSGMASQRWADGMEDQRHDAARAGVGWRTTQGAREILRLRLRMTAWERRLVNGRGVAHDARCTERFFACGSE